MDIIIESHTLKRAEERGTNKEEILQVFKNGISLSAKLNRQSKYLVYDFNNVRNNKFYPQKKVEVIFTIENEKIITITVYVFYGKWEE